MNDNSLRDKVALVTGGSRGLGKAIALGLAKAGADVIIVSRKQEACDAVARSIECMGRYALPVAANMGKADDIEHLLQVIQPRFKKIDILVNNAGINPAIGPLTELSENLFDKMFSVNVKGPWLLASKIAPLMADGGGGSIINILSVAALKPQAYQGFYCASKAALQSLTQVMAIEWAPLNIRVNAIAPGSYRSDLFDSATGIPGFEAAATNASLQKRIAETDEILGPVLYLASDMSRYTTGSTLVADGGHLLS